MMKKLLMLLMAFALVLAPSGLLDLDEASAKSYKSGKKSFAPNNNGSHLNSTTNKQDPNPTSSPVKNTSAATSNKGGFMKGLLFGGLAGLLLGSLFSDLGVLGAILGFLINILAVVGIVMIVRKLYSYFKNQRNKKEYPAWKR